MSIDSKLALLIMGLPLVMLLSLGFGAYFVYGIDPELISALISTVLVALLVWERLRDSLSKKLQYLHQNVLFKLYRAAFGSDYMSLYTARGISILKADLRRYGRFLRIRLYPKNLLERINDFLSLQNIFHSNIQKIIRLAEINIETSPLDINSTRNFFHHLGFDPDRYPQRGSDIQNKEYSQKAKKLLLEQLQLINETKKLDKDIRKAGNQIHKELKNFFKSNNLPFEVTPGPVPRPF